MHHSSLRLATMKPFAHHLFKRPWQCLLLLLLGLPVAWAAGVSINNMVITTLKQLAFAQEKAEVMVGAQFTQAATVRLSPGSVTYRSSNTTVATVNAQTGQVTGVLAGEATIVADQAAAPPYAAASASYALKVKGQALVFNEWKLNKVANGVAPFQITAPTSNAPAGAAISYSLENRDSGVIGITSQGLVTVKAVGKATVVATLPPTGIFEGGSTRAELEVTPADSPADPAAPVLTLVPVNKLFTAAGMTFDITVTSNNKGTPITVWLKDQNPADFASLSRSGDGSWTATVKSAGSARLVAEQAAGGGFNKGETSADFKVTTAALTPNTLALLPFEALAGAGDISIPWTGRNNTVDPITITSSNPSVARVSLSDPSRLTVAMAGETTITLTQPQGNGYAASGASGAPVQARLTVRSTVAQKPQLSLVMPPNIVFGDVFEPQTSTSSDAKVKLKSSDSSIASINDAGEVVSIVGVGTVTITAYVEATAGYSTADQIVTVTTAKADPLLTMVDALSVPVTSAAFELPIKTRSRGVITVASSDRAVADVAAAVPPSVVPRALPGSKVGSTTLTITQAESDHHRQGVIVRTLTTTEKAQTPSIQWNLPSVINATPGTKTIVLPEATSNNAVGKLSYSATLYESSSFDAATRTLNLVSRILLNTTPPALRYNSYTMQVTVSQEASPGFLAAAYTVPVYVYFVDFAAPGGLMPTTLVVDDVPPRKLSEGPFALSVKSNSPAKVQVDNLSGGPVSIDAATNTITPLATGKTKLKVRQAASATYAAAEREIDIEVRSDALPIQAFNPITLVLNQEQALVTIPEPISLSPGAKTYTVQDTSIAEVFGAQLKLKKAGRTTITVEQQAKDGYGKDTAVTDLIVQHQASQLAFPAAQMPTVYTNSPKNFYVQATSKSPAAIRYYSSAPDVATVDAQSGLVTLTGFKGKVSFSAVQDVDLGNWFTAGQAATGLTVDDAANSSGLSLGAFRFALNEPNPTPPYQTQQPSRAVVVSVRAQDAAYAQVDPANPKRLILLKPGQALVTVTHPKTDTQPEASASAFMTITAAVPSLSNLPASISHVWGSGMPTTLELSPQPAGSYEVTTSENGVASVSGTTVTLTGLGRAYLIVTRRADAQWEQASVVIPVEVLSPSSNDPRLPVLVLPNQSLPSTTLRAKLKATSSNTAQPIQYAIEKTEPAGIATISEDGELRVMGAGDVTVRVSQAASLPTYLAHSTTGVVNIQNGKPLFELLSVPTRVKPGEIFEYRYRTNDMANGQGGVVRSAGGAFLTLIGQQAPRAAGEEGVLRFQVNESVTAPQVRIDIDYGAAWFSEDIVTDNGPGVPPQLPAVLVGVDLTSGGAAKGYHLEGPLSYPVNAGTNGPLPSTAPYGAALSPRILDANNAVVGNCNSYVSSDPTVVSIGQRLNMHFMRAGEASVSCAENPALSTRVAVLGLAPQLGGFPSYTLSMDSPAVQVLPPLTPNSQGAWSYEVREQRPRSGSGPVIALSADGKLEPRAEGEAVIRASQLGYGAFNSGFIDTLVTITPSQIKDFQNVTVTYGDKDFQMPRPNSADTSTPFTFSIDKPSVATITTDGSVKIVGAGTATVTATQGSQSVQATLTVLKAFPRLSFVMLPPPLVQILACSTTPVRWPMANENGYPAGSGETVPGAKLSTNSDGRLHYRSNSRFTEWETRGGPYYQGYRGAQGSNWGNAFYRNGIENAVLFKVWVTQDESNNFFPATSEAYEYAGWINNDVFSQEIPGQPLSFFCPGNQ